MRLEVRCCCRPEKLVGWLNVARPVGVVIFPLCSKQPVARGVEGVAVPVHTVALEIADFNDGSRIYPAIKSEDTPIDVLRLIPGFEENLENNPAAYEVIR